MVIQLQEFKALLHTLDAYGIGVKVRTHTGWSNDFLQILGFIAPVQDSSHKTLGGVVLSNRAETEGLLINNIATITAFQLEHDCRPYQANIVYAIVMENVLNS